MNIQNLVGLTTQKKPSDYLANSIPTEPLAGLTDTLSKTGASADDGAGTPAVETTNASSTVSDSSSNPSEEFDTFLTLLTAQIRNQDPLAPLDSTQFVEQLATFSNLELQAEGNQTLESIARMMEQSLLNQNQAGS